MEGLLRDSFSFSWTAWPHSHWEAAQYNLSLIVLLNQGIQEFWQISLLQCTFPVTIVNYRKIMSHQSTCVLHLTLYKAIIAFYISFTWFRICVSFEYTATCWQGWCRSSTLVKTTTIPSKPWCSLNDFRPCT